jgi:hypothetical protein
LGEAICRRSPLEQFDNELAGAFPLRRYQGGLSLFWPRAEYLPVGGACGGVSGGVCFGADGVRVRPHQRAASVVCLRPDDGSGAYARALQRPSSGGGGVVENIDRGMFLALLFTASGEVMVGVEVLRVADPEYVRLGRLLRCRLGAAPSAGRRAARGGIALGAGGGGLGERSALDLDGTTRQSTGSLTSCLLRLP